MSWLPEENLSSFVTIILWQKAWKEQVIQSFHMSFLCWAQVPDDLYAAAILRSRLCYNWIKGAKAYRTGWTPGSSCNWIKIPSPSPTLLGRTADQKVRRPTKGMQESPQLGTQSYRDKKIYDLQLLFRTKKKASKNIWPSFSFREQSANLHKWNGPCQGTSKEEKKIICPENLSKDKSSIGQGRGDLNAFPLKGCCKKQGEYYSYLMISVAVINKKELLQQFINKHSVGQYKRPLHGAVRRVFSQSLIKNPSTKHKED